MRNRVNNNKDEMVAYASKKGWKVSGKVNFYPAKNVSRISSCDRIIDAVRAMGNREGAYCVSSYVRIIKYKTGIETNKATIKAIAKRLGMLVVDYKVFGRAVA